MMGIKRPGEILITPAMTEAGALYLIKSGYLEPGYDPLDGSLRALTLGLLRVAFSTRYQHSIEVTDDMVHAGAAALSGREDDFESYEAQALEVFIAMFEARRPV